MNLKPFQAELLKVGKIVVYLRPANSTAGPRSQMCIVDTVLPTGVTLEPAYSLEIEDALFEVSTADLKNHIFHGAPSIGDKVLFRGKPGSISNCEENGTHVHVVLEESPGAEHYTNLIHLDFSPTLNKSPLR